MGLFRVIVERSNQQVYEVEAEDKAGAIELVMSGGIDAIDKVSRSGNLAIQLNTDSTQSA